MSKEEQLKQLEAQIQNSLVQFSDSAEQTIQNRSQILNAATNELVELHSSQIRNLGLISGVVAPLSLTLLQIQALNIFIPFLLIGFVLLLANIILSQLLLAGELNRKDRSMVKAVLEYLSASTNKWVIDDKSKPSGERVLKMSEFLKNVDEFDRSLNISPHSTELMSANARFRQYTRWVVGIFSLGCALIIASTFFNPLIQLVAAFMLKI